ncbi:sensor of blue-light using FAD [Synechococcus sp. PCC 7502]|uniref:BLUF domain-containing protein n=1 Tax=Synechococcus sp. PCC 7502 TaxID=1173263 RepID=UPI00029FB9AE|nr:BLUF domain-containing protein [Synechococcus sp. PCC 7502]AFY74651.1 sensor of blue-light using FAD [Synechococcus sp. PCC 7502]
MTLSRLIYLSYAAPNLGYSDLLDIMEKSERNNSAAAVTGMLCYGDFMFLQILEGDRKVVSQTYSRILVDKRHFDSELIEFTAIDARLFGGWSMQVVQLDSFMPDQARQILIKYSSSAKYALGSMNARQSLNFMVELSAIYSQINSEIAQKNGD